MAVISAVDRDQSIFGGFLRPARSSVLILSAYAYQEAISLVLADPIPRRPCAGREEKQVTHGRDMRTDKELAAGGPGRQGIRKVRCD